jgi:hypothetical protein
MMQHVNVIAKIVDKIYGQRILFSVVCPVKRTVDAKIWA